MGKGAYRLGGEARTRSGETLPQRGDRPSQRVEGRPEQGEARTGWGERPTRWGEGRTRPGDRLPLPPGSPLGTGAFRASRAHSWTSSDLCSRILRHRIEALTYPTSSLRMTQIVQAEGLRFSLYETLTGFVEGWFSGEVGRCESALVTGG